MRVSRSLLFAGAAVALAGVTAVTAAERQHVMTVRLPDGSLEQIRYSGDVAPKVALGDEVPAPAAMFGFLDTAFGPDSPFAVMDRMSAEMDRQTDAMMRQAAVAAAQPAAAGGDVQMQMTSLGEVPAGAHYSYVSTTIVDGKSCTTSVQTVSQGEGKPAQLLHKVSGDCSAVKAPAAPIPAVALAAPRAPGAVTQVSAPAVPGAPLAPRVPEAPKVPSVPRDTI